MKLRITKAPQGLGREIELNSPGEIVIGRGSSCALCLDDSESSRNHSRIVLGVTRATLEDLSSKNGTYLNGRKVQTAPLSNGDEILIGATLLTVTELPSPAPSTSAGTESAGSILLSISRTEADFLTGKLSSVSREELEHENKILREICRISQLVASKTERQTILQTILDEMRNLLAADTVSLLTCGEGEPGNWIAQASAGTAKQDGELRISRTIIRQAVEEGSAILITNPLGDSRFDPSQSIVVQGVSSALCAPVGMGSVLFLDRRNRKEAFTQLDLRLAASAANILGVFLEREAWEAESVGKARLAAVGEAMASLAHYIKNVITGFRLTLAIMHKAIERQSRDEMEQYLAMLVEQEQRMSGLVMNMLGFVKDRAPSRLPVNVPGIVRAVVDPMRPKLEELGIRFELACDKRVEILFADEMALQRILLNLLLNAMDAFESHELTGERLIRLSVDPLDGAPGAFLRFRDTACGIAPDKLAKIFSAFFSTKGSRGTGLGLTVVQKLVREHGGEVSVDSREHEWTEFRFTIPWGAADEAPAGKGSAQGAPA
jgi:signal transduction histidine kinase